MRESSEKSEHPSSPGNRGRKSGMFVDRSRTDLQGPKTREACDRTRESSEKSEHPSSPGSRGRKSGMLFCNGRGMKFLKRGRRGSALMRRSNGLTGERPRILRAVGGASPGWAWPPGRVAKRRPRRRGRGVSREMGEREGERGREGEGEGERGKATYLCRGGMRISPTRAGDSRSARSKCKMRPLDRSEFAVGVSRSA